jgi:hypothetical protein
MKNKGIQNINEIVIETHEELREAEHKGLKDYRVNIPYIDWHTDYLGGWGRMEPTGRGNHGDTPYLDYIVD